jgi:ankyrin repeat protein
MKLKRCEKIPSHVKNVLKIALNSISHSSQMITNLEKHPIHIACEILDAERLRQLLEADPDIVNQKYDDLTPFHFVADAINEHNFDKAAELIRVLVAHKADINRIAYRSSFHTPFSQLLDKFSEWNSEKANKLIDFIVESYAFIDVDSYRDGETREVLAEYFPRLLPHFEPAKVNPDEFRVDDKEQVMGKLMTNMESDEKRFLRSMFVLEGDPRAADVLKVLLQTGDLLEMAVYQGREASVVKLLQMGMNPNREGHGDICTPVGIACKKGFWRILKKLISLEPVNLRRDPLLHIVVKNLGEKTYSEACDHQKCFQLLIDHKRIDVNASDKYGNTALHYAVRYRNANAVKQLLEKGACIATPNVFNDLPIRDIAPKLLEQYFDTCITTNGERAGDDDYEIRLDYTCLVPQAADKATKKELVPIQYIAKTKELRHLVQHPLISSFLFLKWFRLSPIFYANLFVCSIYCTALVSYIVFCANSDCWMAQMLQSIAFLGAMYLLVREFVQFVIAPVHFLKSFTNYMELLLIVLTGVILCAPRLVSLSPDETRTIRHMIGPVTIMLVAYELSILVGSLPFFTISTHFVMLKTVSISFMRGLILYSIMLLGFAFSFYTLFSSTPEESENKDDELNRFIDPARALVKTIVMLTGEFEASSIDFQQNALSYWIFVMFLFFMSIVVLNLLNGLAVSDTQQIKAEAELNNWLERTNLLAGFESILSGVAGNNL